MTRTLVNAGAALLALAASTVVARCAAGPREGRAVPAPVEVEAGRMRDAGGVLAPPGPYRRIASASTVADQILLELVEPERIVALTGYGARTSPRRHLYGARPTIERLDDPEAILALRADLLLVHGVGDAGRVARLREAGVTVFDLGDLRGLETLLADVRAVAALAGARARGEHLVAALDRRARAIAAALPQVPRCRALYLAAYGGSLFGGTAGSSYHDVLTLAGLVDAAAAAGHRGWPAYSPEDILALDPQVLVTKTGMAGAVCRAPGVSRVTACSSAGQVVEVDGDVLDDPGPLLIEAAERVHDAVYLGPSRVSCAIPARGP